MDNNKEQALVLAEETAKMVVDAVYDRLLEMILDEVKKAIPGQVDDMIIDTMKPIVAPKMKALLLEQIAKIDGK